MRRTLADPGPLRQRERRALQAVLPRRSPRPADHTLTIVGVESIVSELRACTPDELPGVRASFAAIASDPDATDAWRRLARAAVPAIDRMAGGADPAATLDALEADLTAAGIAAQAAAEGRDGSRSKARRRRRRAT